MPDLVLLANEYSGYLSITKLLVFLVMFFAWLPLVTWVHNDAKQVETKEGFWAGIVLAAGALGAFALMIIPIFIIGMLFFMMAVGATSLAYVKHRNARVLDFDRVLTAEHIKSLFAGEDKKLEELKSFLFITANNNEVPMPEPRTPDFFGYKIAYEVLTDALWRRADNIMFAPAQQSYNVTYYVDGAAIKQPDIPSEQIKYLIPFLKHVADLDIKEKRKPQKGKFTISRNKEDIEWEVVTAGSTVGEQLRLKKITHESISKLTGIGLMKEQYEQITKFKELKQGIFIVAGPKKSGVTTTFYSLLRHHDAFTNSINTLEKQPTVELPNITQNVFSPSDADTTTYAKKLEQIIRMGPDIVGVADCEDSKTAKAAWTGAGDGKIIYVEIRADSVMQALAKWMKFIGNRNLALENLIGICNQRLLRKLCNECKQAYTPNEELFRKFNINAEKTKALYRAGKVQYDKHGKEMTCEHCQGTGYVERTGVFEMVILNDELKNIIKQAKSLPEIATQFRRAKMLYLQEQALRKVIAGITAINEMIRVLSSSKTPNQNKR